MTEQQRGEPGHLISTAGLAAAATVLLFVLHLTSHRSYTLFHTLAESFSICISVGVFMFAWNSRRFMGNGYFLLLGVASLFTGFLDGIHTLAYKGMGIFGGIDPNPATEVWIATRYIMSISLLMAPVFLKRKLSPALAFGAYAVVTVLALMSIFSWGIFPDCYIEGTGLTSFKIVSEYVIVLILLGALAGVLALRQSFDERVLRLISGSIVFSIISEVAFTQYLGVYDLANQLGHVLKIIASYLIYRSVIYTGLRNPYDLVFRSLRQNQEELNRVNLELKSLASEQDREIVRRRKAEDELRSHRDDLEKIVQGRTMELEERNLMLAEEIAVRMRAEQDLQKSMQEIEDLYNNAPCGYHSLDPDGVCIRMNDTELSLLGYTREEILGKVKFADLVAPASRQLFEESFSRLRRQGWTSGVELEMTRKDGSSVPVLLNETAIMDEDGAYVRSRSTLFDITERKKMEEEIRKAVYDWQHTFDSMKDQVMVLDRDFRIDRVNAAAASFFNVPHEDITHSHCHSLMHHSDGPIDGCPMARMLVTRRHEEAEVYDEIRDIWLIASVDPIFDETGNIVRTIHTVRDITESKRTEEEKKKLEAQLLQAQKMEALGRFAGGIAHDLNNMLYPIILNSQSLLGEVPEGTPWRQSIQLLLDAAYRQRELVKQILSFSRHNEQKLVPVQVKPLLDETLAFLRSSLPKTIEIVEHNDAAHDTILGNSTQIQQIVMNLCRNAADAIEPGTGVIEVKVENVLLEPSPPNPGAKTSECLRIIVRDTGRGMAPDVASRIFEPFYTTKGVGKGTGMGLAVVHGILKNHGGSIKVESEPGKGSLFTIDLPLTGEKPRERTSGTEPIRPAGEKKRVLLVDDEQIILSSLKRVLRVLGYDVVTCMDSQEAVDLFSRSPDDFDVVITDQTMPQMTGVELSLTLLKIRPDMPIILCTGFSDAIDEKKIRSMGIRELLMKPADISEVRAAIGRAVDSPRLVLVS